MTDWPSVRLGDVLHRRRDVIDIQETEIYKRITIRMNGRGITIRDSAYGREIGTKRQFISRFGQLVLSKIDARNGAFGIVPPECDGAIITGNFWTFDTDPHHLDARFLNYLTMSPLFVDFCIRASEGTTNRRYLQEPKFLAQRVDLPSLAEQRRIVSRIEELAAKVEEAQGLRHRSFQEANTVSQSATSRIFDDLSHCPQAAIGTMGQDGANPVQTGPFGAQLHSSDFVEQGVPVLNVGNVWPEGLRFDRLDHVLPDKAEQLNRYALKPNDLLFARSGATLGKVCIVPEQCNDWLMTGHLFRVRFDDKRCLPHFAFAALRGARSVLDQVFGAVRGATRPGFNTTLLSRVRLPLPPLDEQQCVVTYLDGLQGKVDAIKRLQRETAAELDALMPSILSRAFRGDL
jgi:type I restriction enzyme, S subunit